MLQCFSTFMLLNFHAFELPCFSSSMLFIFHAFHLPWSLLMLDALLLSHAQLHSAHLNPSPPPSLFLLPSPSHPHFRPTCVTTANVERGICWRLVAGLVTTGCGRCAGMGGVCRRVQACAGVCRRPAVQASRRADMQCRLEAWARNCTRDAMRGMRDDQ